jgi:hypothetical protein
VREKMNRISAGINRILARIFAVQPRQHQMHIGPNRVVIEVRRAKRDPNTRLAIRDEFGNIIYNDQLEIYENHNVTNNTGLEAAKDRLFNTATTQTVAKYIALSESAGAPNATHTVLAAEITLSGLPRAEATYSVAGCGTGQCILSKAFTATASIAAVQLMGLFDTSSAGDMYFEATFTPVALESDDQLTAKWDKITLS